MRQYWVLAVLALIFFGIFAWLCQDKTPGLFAQGSTIEIVSHYRGLEGPRMWRVERHTNRSLIMTADRRERNFPSVSSVVDLKDERGQVYEYYIRDILEIQTGVVSVELRSVR